MTATIANTVEFKGFNIYEMNGRFCPQDKGDANFKSDGYATMSGAKGAITKYENAKAAEVAELKTEMVELKAKAAEAPESAPVAVETVKATDTATSETNRAIAAVQAMASARAVRPSRNKREGRYDGNTGGRAVRMHNNIPGLMSFRPYPANRKQRKATAIASKGGV